MNIWNPIYALGCAIVGHPQWATHVTVNSETMTAHYWCALCDAWWSLIIM